MVQRRRLLFLVFSLGLRSREGEAGLYSPPALTGVHPCRNPAGPNQTYSIVGNEKKKTSQTERRVGEWEVYVPRSTDFPVQ